MKITNVGGMRTIVLLGAFLVAVASLPGQTNTGTITGTVVDPSQAAVPAVRVTASNLATNVSQSATTNGSGVYSIPALEPGAYRVTLEREGFRKIVQEPVTLESSATVALDFRLAVGATSSEVTVTADTPLVQNASST